MKKILLLVTMFMLVSSTAFAVVSGEALMNVQDTTAPTGVVQTNRVKDLGTNGVTGLTSGVMACGDVMWDTVNTVFTAVRGDTTSGLWTQVKAFSGGKTPSDAYANPTDAIDSFSLLAGFNNTTWDRLHSEGNAADGIATQSAGILVVKADNMVFNGTTWDRVREGVNTGTLLVDNTSNNFVQIATSTTTVVKATGGVTNLVVTNAAGTGWSMTFYNIASAGCTGTPVSGNTFTFQQNTLGQVINVNHTFPLGICVVTTGATPGNLTVTYR